MNFSNKYGYTVGSNSHKLFDLYPYDRGQGSGGGWGVLIKINIHLVEI